MKKITCSLINSQDSIILKLKEVSKIFGDKLHLTPGDDENSILSNSPIDFDDQLTFLNALIEFDNADDEKDEHDFDEEDATFEIIEKKGGSGPDGYGKFILKIDEEELEVTVPKRSKLYDE